MKKMSMTAGLIARGVKRYGMEVTNLPFFKPMSMEHRSLFLACQKEFGHVFVGGDYARFLAQRQKTFKSYCITIVFDIDDPDNDWEKIHIRIRDPVVQHQFWYIPALHINNTVCSEYSEVDHYYLLW